MLATGVDLITVSRIARTLERFGPRFLERVFTPAEVQYSRERSAELAARFAGKEATAKALGVGMRMLSPLGVGWQEIEVLNERSGKPYVILHDHAEELAQRQGLTEWTISLSHDGDFAIAFVVAMSSAD